MSKDKRVVTRALALTALGNLPVAIMRCPICMADVHTMLHAAVCDLSRQHQNLGAFKGPIWTLPAICENEHRMLIRLATKYEKVDPPYIPKDAVKTLIWVDQVVTKDEYDKLKTQLKGTSSFQSEPPTEEMEQALGNEKSTGFDLQNLLKELGSKGLKSVKHFSNAQELAAYLAQKKELAPTLKDNSSQVANPYAFYYLPSHQYPTTFTPNAITMYGLACPDCNTEMDRPIDMFFCAFKEVMPVMSAQNWHEIIASQEFQVLETFIAALQNLQFPMFDLEECLDEFGEWVEISANEIVETARTSVAVLMKRAVNIVFGNAPNRPPMMVEASYMFPLLMNELKFLLTEIIFVLAGGKNEDIHNHKPSDHTEIPPGLGEFPDLDFGDDDEDDTGEEWKKG